MLHRGNIAKYLICNNIINKAKWFYNETPVCIRRYNMLAINFKYYLLLCVCLPFMYVSKGNIEKYMCDISSGVPTKRRESRHIVTCL